ncbi:MAG: FHA domain-containing protein [Pseudomonadales bacterium]|nr:FHA domain-containing protein [Pseudomonadales bacterium]
MESLVIRLGLRHGRLTEFVKVKADSLSVGRALKNDLVLSDPFVAAEQVRFFRTEEGWNMEVMDFTNPVMVNDEPVNNKHPCFLIGSGDNLILGRTHLILLAEDHPTDATRAMVFSRWLHNSMLRPLIPLLMLTLACLISGLSEYSILMTEFKWVNMAMTSLIIVLAGIGWAGQWALAGRILHHQPHFFAQPFYTSLVLAAISLVGLVEGYIEYMTNSVLMEDIFIQVCVFILVAALLKYNLSYATHIHQKWMIAFAVTGIGAVVIFSFVKFSESDFKASPEYSQVLRPPIVKILGNQSVDEFMIELEDHFEIVELEISEWENE